MKKPLRLAWGSDWHLDFVKGHEIHTLCQTVKENADALLLTGDLSTAKLIRLHLKQLASQLDIPIFFTLGNHDYYQGSFASTETIVREACSACSNLVRLGQGEIVSFGNTALIGVDGWADGRAGLGSTTQIRLNDSALIEDLCLGDARSLFAKMRELGDDSARYIAKMLPLASEGATHIIVATHVPPFVEAARYNGRPSDEAFAPHFTNLALGQVLRDYASEHREINVTVLCGHTHGRFVFEAAPNLHVRVAGGLYRRPAIEEVLHLDHDSSGNR